MLSNLQSAGRTRLLKALLAGCIAGMAGTASAQAPKPKPPAPAQAAPQAQPAQQQAQPAPQGNPPGAGGPQGPMRVELNPTQTQWTKVCGHDSNANKDVCYTTRDFGTQADQPPVLALAVYDVKGDDQRIVRFLMPVGLMLRPGFRFSIDKGASLEGAFEICFPNGCFGEVKIKQPMLDAMKKGQVVNVAVKNQANNEVTFAVPIAGFGDAFDGPAIDPKVLEEQQKKLQAEMQKKADDMKKNEAAKSGAPAPAGK